MTFRVDVLGLNLTLILSLPNFKVINVKFPLQPHQKDNITQYEELGFSSLTQMQKMAILQILTTSLIRFSSKVGRVYLLK